MLLFFAAVDNPIWIVYFVFYFVFSVFLLAYVMNIAIIEITYEPRIETFMDWREEMKYQTTKKKQIHIIFHWVNFTIFSIFHGIGQYDKQQYSAQILMYDVDEDGWWEIPMLCQSTKFISTYLLIRKQKMNFWHGYKF